MEKNKTKNKAEPASDDVKETEAQSRKAAMLERVANVSDDELLAAYEEMSEGFKIVNAEAANRGLALGVPKAIKRDPEAGRFEGSFICRRGMQGDKQYQANDKRSGQVAEFEHLVRSGAVSPADDETAKAVEAWTGLKLDVFTPPASEKED